MTEPQTPSVPPLKVAIIPVTPLQQNCTLVWCTKTMRGAFIDAGGDLALLRQAIAKTGLTIEKLLVTHGHIDHCGSTGIFARELGVPIEGPEEADRFWIARLNDDGRKYGIDGESQGILRSQAQWLARYAGKSITIEGHCDERGTREYNLALGERRANAAKNYLISLGVDGGRIQTVSYGKERPVALGSDEAAWAKNRRAVTITVN